VRWSQQATQDPAQVEAWWNSDFGYPTDGVGIVTGTPSNLLVLDIDPRHGGVETLARLEEKHGPLPRTVTARTGSDGLHKFFEAGGGKYRSTVGLLGPGLDTRGEGGFVVAAPSLHRSGKRYEWLYGPRKFPIAPAPTWLTEQLTRPQTPAPTRRSWKSMPTASLKQSLRLLRLIEQDSLTSWLVEHAEEVSYELWRAFATNIAAVAVECPAAEEEARALFHEISAADQERYCTTRTDSAFGHAMQSVDSHGPVTYARMIESGAPEELCQKGQRSLIAVARFLLSHPELLVHVRGVR
jgi:hypothetical protein